MLMHPNCARQNGFLDRIRYGGDRRGTAEDRCAVCNREGFLALVLPSPQIVHPTFEVESITHGKRLPCHAWIIASSEDEAKMYYERLQAARSDFTITAVRRI